MDEFPVAPNDRYPFQPGSVAEVIAHLALWCESVDSGLARVAYFSEMQRDAAIAGLQDALQKAVLPFAQTSCSVSSAADDPVGGLLSFLDEQSEGVVSLVWTTDGFLDTASQANLLRTLNFQRENLTRFPVRQLWWIPQTMAQTMAAITPDLDRWFMVRLELRQEETQSPLFAATPSTSIFMVPTSRNPFFMGREQPLKKLYDSLHQGQRVLITQAISGLGGIGKTQLATEYAYRYRDRYRFVLWTQADSPEAIDTGYRAITRVLSLPEKDSLEAEVIRASLKRWLEENTNYLLIFDNADNPEVIRPFLPTSSRGHILLTSRARQFNALGQVSVLQLAVLREEESFAFLLQRIYRGVASERERGAMTELIEEMNGRPLALEQAAAYIVEKQIPLSLYLTEFRQRRAALLGKVGPVRSDYRETVLSTWQPNFDAVADANPDAAELLRICAFLAPDDVPFELFDVAVDNPLPLLPLERYSLITVGIDSATFAVHRLVQEAIKATLGGSACRKYAEKAIEIVCSAYPGSDFVYWPKLDRLLIHQLQGIEHIRHYNIQTESAIQILNQAALYLKDCGKYVKASDLLEQASRIASHVYPAQHPMLATSLNNLALLYESQGHYTEAEPLFQQALQIRQASLPEGHPDIATSLNNLARVNAYWSNCQDFHGPER